MHPGSGESLGAKNEPFPWIPSSQGFGLEYESDGAKIDKEYYYLRLTDQIYQQNFVEPNSTTATNGENPVA